MAKRVTKKGRSVGRMTELDRLMDEGTVNMLAESSGKSAKSPTSPRPSKANKKASLEALRLKRLQVLSNVRNRSADSGKNRVLLREKKTIRRRSTDSLPLSQALPFKGRRASLLATLKETRGGKVDLPEFEPIKDPPVKKRILTTVTEDGLGHLTISFDPNSRWTIDSKALGDLTKELTVLEENPRVKIILVSSSGAKFCNGIDLRELIVTNPVERRAVALNLAQAVKAFLSRLGSCSKLTILSAHSSASNLFTTCLPLFDLVYASDKAVFRTNYLSLHQSPEGAAVLQELARPAFTSLVYGRRTLTASEAKDLGLVTEVLWPARFHEEVVIRVRAFLRSETTTTRMIKTCLNPPSSLSADSLSRDELSLVSCWTSDDFQKAARNYVNERGVIW